MHRERTWSSLRKKIGMVFQKPNPFPKSIWENVAYGPKVHGVTRPGRAGPDRGGEPPARGALGRGEGPAERFGARALRRPAAAALHCPDARGRAGSDPDGRALLGARPDRNGKDREPDRDAQAGVHGHHRHPQHAAGGTGERLHGVHVPRETDRVREDRRRSSSTRQRN